MKANIFFLLLKDLDTSSCPGCKWYFYRLQQEGGLAKVIEVIKQELHP